MFKFMEDAVATVEHCEVVNQPGVLDQEAQLKLGREILPKLITVQGFRSKASPEWDDKTYFVWRMTRFHGGKDLRMPIAAEMRVRNEPRAVRDFLDSLAGMLAEQFFGSSIEAAKAWSGALGVL